MEGSAVLLGKIEGDKYAVGSKRLIGQIAILLATMMSLAD